LAASKWIIFPNYFQDQSIESAEARLSIINESFPSLDYEQRYVLEMFFFVIAVSRIPLLPFEREKNSRFAERNVKEFAQF